MPSSVDLLNELHSITIRLRENSALEMERTELQRQLGEMKKELAVATAKHSEKLDELRYATDAKQAVIEQTKLEQRKLDTVKAELKSFFAFGKAA